MFVGGGCACAIGVLAIAEESKSKRYKQWAYGKFGITFSDGFMDGFDGWEESRDADHEPEEYTRGFKNGRAVWNKVKNLRKENV
jgi:hypothetical protein